MSDDNTKDWANIRIEEPVRDDARDDPRTYTEIMRAGLNAPSAGPEKLPGDARDTMRVANVDDLADAIAERMTGKSINPELLAAELADELSGQQDVTLEASERRAIAEEVAEVLGR